tara:strand:+ start:28 stop:543 length:516 start_codon:yes stop_codon:yes gene_type:complete
MINEEYLSVIDATNFKVTKPYGYSILEYKNRYGGYENFTACLIGYFNDCDGCNYNTCFNNLVYGDVLVIGLGLGLIPEYIRQNKNYTTIDVVEDDPELVEYVDYLHEDINIISTSDCEAYSGTKKYDLIILEYYGDVDDITPNKMTNLYTPQLKDDGVMIWPLTNKIIRHA